MTPVQLIAPFLGGAILEAIHWYQLRNKLTRRELERALRNPAYWGITIAMIVLGGAGALVLFEGKPAAQLLVAGAAMPALLHKLVSAFVKEHAKLGPEDEQQGLDVASFFQV